MLKSRRITGLAAAAALMATTAACTTDPDTGQRRVSRAGLGAGVGAAGGALLGTLVGGRRSRTEAIVGAGIGALAGAGVGAYMDKQERDLRAKTAGTGVEVERQGDDLLLKIPSGITFDTNSYAIQPGFRPTLDQVATTLKDYPQTYIDVYGHTDSTGSDAINLPLSRNRAQAVADYLGVQGVQRARIGTQGFGSSQPVATNDTADGRAQNRRVEIKIVPVTDQAAG
ncbi:MAG: OmpA family protein [Sphingomonas fennica]